MSRQASLYARWFQETRRSRLFRPSERVGVAVSGGADSVLLLEFMVNLGREMGLPLAVVHFNHQLRGAESNADEAFVRQLAHERGLEFLVEGADVARAARERRRNLEATARELRYRYFFSLTNSGRLDKVATAHTANDQAETVLLRLLRGAGTRGLGGIHPVLEERIVRPFLNLTRAEIESELARLRLAFRLDSSNLDPGLRRNKVRRQLLPLLEREFNPAVVRLLKDFADRARADEAYLEQQSGERARPWRVREGSEEKIPLRALLEFPVALERRILRQMAQGARGAPGSVTATHIEALRRFAREAQSGRRLEFPGGLEARKQFDWLILAPTAPERRAEDYAYRASAPGTVPVPELGLTLRLKIVGSRAPAKAYNGVDSARLDPAKLAGGLTLRNWRPGDTFRPLGSRKPQKLKELFRQQRIPPGQRRLWPVLECGKEIVWVRGFPPSELAAASPDLKEFLVIQEGSSTQLETSQKKDEKAL